MRLHRSFSVLSIAAALALLLVSCSGSGSPLAPASGESTLAPTPAAVPSIPSDVGLLGALTVRVDPATLTATADPVRLPTVYGDNFWLNATGFLDGIPCKDCFGVTGVSRDVDGNVVLKVNARHPFAAGNPALPISGVNRLDLHVFDAAVLVAGDLDNATGSFTGGSATVPSRLVRNAAGYSALLTSVVQSLDPTLAATAFPYVMLNEDRTAGNFAGSNPTGFADLEAPMGMNVFPMGADVTSDVVLGIESTDAPVELTLLFTCSYGASVHNRSERLNPRYCLPEFNTKPAWKVEVDIPAISNTLQEGQPASSATVNVRVWDWQQSATIDAALDNFTSIRASSDVASVSLLIPGLRSTSLDLGTPISGTGPLDDPLTYSTVVTNAENALEGDYVAIVEVVDSRTTGMNAGGATDGLSSIKGTTIDPVAIGRFVTYQTAELSVSTGVTRQLLSIAVTPTARQIIAQGAGEAVTFTAIGTFDMPPLTEDISATVTWISSATDVGTFTANVLTGVGMGRTYVHAESGAIDSSTVNPATEVIVKPVEFLAIPGNFGYEIDAHQAAGEFYVSYTGPNRVVVYNENGIVQRQWNITDFLSFTRGITVDETLGIVYVSSGQPGESLNIIKYDTNGTRLTGFAPGTAGLTWNFQGIVLLDNGQLWHRPFTPQTTYRYDNTTGAILDTWNGASFVSSVYDSDNVGNIMFHSNPGYRTSGRAIAVVDPQAHQVLGWGGINPMPPGYSQNTVIAVDRDNFIHLGWSVGAPFTNPLIDVYEYQAPNTILGPIYTYQPTVAGSSPNGIAVSRIGNVLALNSSTPARTTFFH